MNSYPYFNHYNHYWNPYSSYNPYYFPYYYNNNNYLDYLAYFYPHNNYYYNPYYGNYNSSFPPASFRGHNRHNHKRYSSCNNKLHIHKDKQYSSSYVFGLPSNLPDDNINSHFGEPYQSLQPLESDVLVMNGTPNNQDYDKDEEYNSIYTQPFMYGMQSGDMGQMNMNPHPLTFTSNVLFEDDNYIYKTYPGDSMFEDLKSIIERNIPERYEDHVYHGSCDLFPDLTIFVVTKEKNEVVGVILGKVNFYNGYYSPKSEGHIGLLAVDEAHRRKGIATKLIGLMIETYIRNYNVDHLMIETEEKNEIARNLYEKFGFKIVVKIEKSCSDFIV